MVPSASQTVREDGWGLVHTCSLHSSASSPQQKHLQPMIQNIYLRSESRMSRGDIEGSRSFKFFRGRGQ